MSLALVTLADQRAVRALLDRYLDWLPPARLSVARPDRAGRSPREGGWRACTRCAATGRVTGEGPTAKACRQKHDRWPSGHGCRPCVACDSGYIAVPDGGRDLMLNPGKNDFVVDDHGRGLHEQRRHRDAQLVKLAALQRQHDGKEAPGDELDRALKAKEHLWKTGSFAQLEAAMELLAVTMPLRLQALVVFVIEAQFDPNPATQLHLDETIVWLAERMPRPILLPGDARDEIEAWKHSLQHGKTLQHRRDRLARDAEIGELANAHGWSLRRVGALYSLSPEGVRKILAGQAGVLAAVASGPAA